MDSARRGSGPTGDRLDRGAYLTGILLLLIAAGAWVGTIRQSTGMAGASTGMGGMSGIAPVPMLGFPVEAIGFLVAWGVMMTAMMLPSAAPMIALYGSLSRRQTAAGRSLPSTAIFALTYVLVWVAFGVPIFAAHLLIGQLAATNPGIEMLFGFGVALALVTAGLYQLSPLKHACLRACRTPLGFLMGHWRNGYLGALRLGLRHSLTCVGCCVGLMVVLVAAGAMSLPWALLIATLVFLEKVLPGGKWTARLSAVALILLGVLVAIQPTMVPLIQGASM